MVVLVGVVGAGCLEPQLRDCPDGVSCPMTLQCGPMGGCFAQSAIDACETAPMGAACTYDDVTQGVCEDLVCLPVGCGNSVITSDEVCDDGNTINNDDCSADCKSNNQCGNASLDLAVGEQCDDGNLVDGDGCSALCQLPRCGDGTMDVGEQCDDGPANSLAPDAPCRTNCQLRRCGDGIFDTASGELCDDGNNLSGDLCSADCRSLEECGNGIPDFVRGEQCDDGNLVNHDGCSQTCIVERTTWTSDAPRTPAARAGAALAYDPARRTLVLFGGLSAVALADTWEWNGRWHLRTPPGSPPARSGHAMIYDPARDRIVLFGGRNGTTFLDDTWEYDGATWTRLAGAAAPPRRAEHGIAYDALRDRIVVFGGRDSLGAKDDTWTFESATGMWTMQPLATPPSRRSQHAMAYDPIHARTVVFGGRGPSGVLGDLWTWDGTSASWVEANDVGAPTSRAAAAMTFDPAAGVLVLYGGYTAITPLTRSNGIFELAGASWSTRTAPPVPERGEHAMAMDLATGYLVVFGGSGVNGGLADTWTYRADENWDDETIALVPLSRRAASLTYDKRRGRIVLFGGERTNFLGDTHEWDGAAWTLYPVAGPPPRANHAAVYDTEHARTVIFGGRTLGNVPLGDVWEWNGASWSARTGSALQPPVRFNAGAAYDAARDEMVVFGGFSGGVLGDTWTWSGASGQWSAALPTPPQPSALAPAPRQGAAMAYDRARERVVLFGGVGASAGAEVNFDDTWEWTGAAWVKLTPVGPSPPAGSARRAVYLDAAARVAVIDDTGDTWTWDGTSWTHLAFAELPTPLADAAFAYNAVTAEVMRFGGAAETPRNDTWLMTSASTVPVEACETQRDLDGDAQAGCEDQDCWAVCSPRCPPQTSCESDVTPRCGDGMCDALETCGSCPGDCPNCALCGDGTCDPSETCPGDCP